MILSSDIVKSVIRQSIHNVCHMTTVHGRMQYHTELASDTMWHLNLNGGSYNLTFDIDAYLYFSISCMPAAQLVVASPRYFLGEINS